MLLILMCAICIQTNPAARTDSVLYMIMCVNTHSYTCEMDHGERNRDPARNNIIYCGILF